MGSGWSRGYGSYGGGYSGGFGSSSSYGMGVGQNENGQPNPSGPMTFRQEYQSLFNGMFSALHIMYAGVGIINFGSIFFKMGRRVLGFLFRGSWKLLTTIFGLGLLKRLIRTIFSGNKTASSKFSNVLDHVWSTGQTASTFGRILTTVQIVCLIGAASFYFLKSDVAKRMSSMKRETPQDPTRTEKNDERNLESKETLQSSQPTPGAQVELNQNGETSERKEESKDEVEIKEEQIRDKAENLNQQTSEEFWPHGALNSNPDGSNSPLNDDDSYSNPIYSFVTKNSTQSTKNPEETLKTIAEEEKKPSSNSSESLGGLFRGPQSVNFKPVQWNKKMPWLRQKGAPKTSPEETNDPEVNQAKEEKTNESV